MYTGSGTGDNPQNGEAISVSAGKLVLKNGTVNMVNDEAGGSVYWGIRVHGTGSLAMSKVTVTSEDLSSVHEQRFGGRQDLPYP